MTELIPVLRKVMTVNITDKGQGSGFERGKDTGEMYINLNQIVSLSRGNGFYALRMSNGDNMIIKTNSEIFKEE